ncbi:MAG: MMPL family transporter [Rhodobacterales bacterium]|nr:MMPL family transporter [Rhodobacterales bacterium]
MAGSQDEGFESYPLGEGIVRLRWLIIIVSLAITVATGVGLPRLTMETDSRVYFAADNPDRLALEALEETYTKDNNVMIVLAPKDGKVFSPRVLGLVKMLTEEAWQAPFSRRVDSLTNFQYSRAEGDDLVIGDLIDDPEALTEDDLARLKDVAMTRKALFRKIISEKADVTAVNITVLNPGESLDEIPQVAAFARDLVAKTKADYPDVDFHITGGVMIDQAFAEAAETDTKTLIPAMLVLVIGIVMVSLRAFMGTLVTVVVIAMSVVTTLGLAGWYGLVLNSSTAASPVIIMTLAVAHSVHILAAMGHFMAGGADRRSALIEAVRVDMSPIAITSLTTAIGFLTLNFSVSPPLQELGNLVAIGVVVAFLYSVIFFPAVVSMLPIKAPKPGGMMDRFMPRLAEFVIARRKALLVVTGLILVVLGVGVTRIQLDDDFVRYFDHRYQFRVDADFTEERLTGLQMLELSLPSGEESGITNPDYLAKLDAFADWFRQQDNVVHVSVLSDTLKRLNENLNADDPSFYRVPETSEMAAQYLMIYEMSVPFGLDLNSAMDIGKSQSRMTVTVSNVKASQVLALAAKGEDWMQKNWPEMWGGVKTTGMSMAVSRISDRNIRSMLGGTLAGLVLISLVLLIVLRSVPIGLISLAPNLLPAVIAFGIWGYLFVEVNLAISVVVAMTLGIVVDDTVHLLSKYLRARREKGLNQADAVRYAMGSVGIALIVTSVALVAGFGLLATSGFAVNADMGLLSAITIAVALLTDFLFLPPLLIYLDRRKS